MQHVFNSTIVCSSNTLISAGIFPKYLTKELSTTPVHPITTGTISTLCMFHSSLISIPRSVYFSIFSSHFSMILWSFGMVTSINSTVCSRLSTNIMSGRLALISLSVCVLKSNSILKFSFSSTGEGSY